MHYPVKEGFFHEHFCREFVVQHIRRRIEERI